MSDLSKKLQDLSPEKLELLRRKMVQKRHATTTTIKLRPNQNSYPMSFGQEGFWFLEQLERRNGVNNIAAALHIKGALNLAAIKKAAHRLWRRHAILQTVIKAHDGAPEQTVSTKARYECLIDESTDRAARHQNAELDKIIHNEISRPFDLSVENPFRINVFRLTDVEFVLLFVAHHIAVDAWSIGLIIDDFIRYYRHFSNNESIKEPDVTVTYFDYAFWQRESLSSTFQKQIEFWRANLADSSSFLALPTDYVRPQVQTFRGEHISFHISKEITSRLAALAKQSGATMFMILLTAYNILLFRLTGQQDINIGTPLANRDLPGIEKLVGLFINTVVMRLLINSDKTILELINSVRETTLNAFSNKDVPFEKVVDTLHPQRNASYNPLFQTLFNFHNTSFVRYNCPGLEITPLPIESGIVKFDIVLSIELSEADLHSVWGYNCNLFTQNTSERFINYFKTIVNEMSRDASQKVGEIPLLTQNDIKQLEEWSSTVRNKSVRYAAGIHHLFEQQVEKSPQAVALIRRHRQSTAIEQLSFAELNARANRLAHYLLKQGLVMESRIGVCLDRSMNMIVALLAILKAGGAYVPIDPNYPQERIRYIERDASLFAVLTDSRHAYQFDCPAIDLDKEQNRNQDFPSGNPNRPICPDQLAYLIYTSGSTGQPKAVMVPHASLINHSLSMTNFCDLGKSDQILQFITLTFDAAGEEIFPALLNGATLVLPDAANELTAADIYDHLEKDGISILHLPVAVWHTLIDYIAERSLAVPATLRMVLAGGECPSVDKLQVFQNLSACKIPFVNVYGPTETTITALANKVAVSSEFPFQQIPIGRPIANISVHILDDSFNPVPPGVKGELYIGGAGLSRGYWERPDLTSEQFLPNPFVDTPGERLYRTGDLARFTADGDLLFLGRIDHQVKVRGFRVELEELERALMQHPSIEKAVALVNQKGAQDGVLVAYLVGNPEAHLENNIREFLSCTLPYYMIPSVVVRLDDMPMTTTGKIDRRALADLPIDGEPTGKEYVPPRDKLETYIHSLFLSQLKVEKLSIHDNFFERGGSSIQGAVLVNKLQDDLGEYVYIVAIYDAPTIATMADYLRTNYPIGVAKLIGEEQKQNDARKKMDENDVQALNKIIKFPAPFVQKKHDKNQHAVFVLSAPRSGSTLLRAILGGNSKLFAPPELQLLNFNTMAERRQELSGRDAFWLDGTVRAVMELCACDEQSARAIIEECEKQNMPVKEFYRFMQSKLDDRLFVDKTPNYALSSHMLQRVEDYFDNALYIHLIRHPYAVIPSFEKAKLHVFYPPFFSQEHPYSSIELAELVWIVSHKNIVQFLKEIPRERQFRILYEDLVTDVQTQVYALCDFIGIPFESDMLEPQKEKAKRMTDALNDQSKMLGDVRFHEHKGITSGGADRWKKSFTHDYLGDVTWNMAEFFGYSRQDVPRDDKHKKSELPALVPVSRHQALPLSFNQQRLWFLDHLEPNSPFYNMFSAIEIQGSIDSDKLEIAINRVVQRHEILRTRFETVDGRPQQRIALEYHINLTVLDLSQYETFEHDDYVSSIARKEAQKPFDLKHDFLLRPVLLRLSPVKHVFLLTMHHIVCDGWSMELIVRELVQFYLNPDQSFPALKVQYADFAAWQRRMFETPAVRRQLDFWVNELADAPALLEMPTDRPRPAVQTFHGGKIFFDFSADLASDVIKKAQQQQTTTFVVLLAAFYALLQRYSGMNDICIGTPIANRTRPELEPLIGLFAGTLVLRTRLFDQPNFQTLIDRVKQTVTNALTHQDVPFEQIVNALDVERNASFTPLFQVMFSHQHAPENILESSELSYKPLTIDNGTAKFDITFSVVEDASSFRVMLEYNTDLFDAETMQQFASHYQYLLGSAISNPERSVVNLHFLTHHEHNDVRTRHARSKKEFQLDESFVSLFERQLPAIADTPAVVYEKDQLTYAELNTRANQLAHLLRTKDVGPESFVGVCMPRSTSMLVAIVSVLKAGAAYVPLDPTYPKDRLEFILKDAQCPVVITADLQDLSDIFDNSEIMRIDFARDAEQIARQKTTNPEPLATSLNAAYVIYTSGSTGRPKGVVVQHRSTLNLFYSLQDQIYRYHQLKNKNASLNAPILFDASVQQLVLLLDGFTLYNIPDNVRADAGLLVEYIRHHQIEVLDCVPSQLKLVIEFGLFDHSGLSPAICLPGGEAIDAATWDFMRTRTKTRFYNMYGPTECTVDSTMFPVDQHESPALGTAIPNAQIYILDDYFQPVPTGVLGEICIAGEGLARGYLHRPDLTADKFIPNPFSADPGSRLYRTGDLGRFNNAGLLEFRGRLDDQVKVRGYRIELGDIEHHLKQDPSVRDAVVVAKERSAGVVQIVAYVIFHGDEHPSTSDCQAHLRSKLPDYMVPALFMTLEAFPKLPNGKIDRKRLPDVEDEAVASCGFVAPESENEKALVEIWAHVLRRENLSVTNNFFELGGDSILSIQMISLARQQGLILTAKDVFAHPTIRELAQVVKTTPIVYAEQGAVQGESPLIPIQRAFFERNPLDPHHFNQSLLLELDEPIDYGILKQILFFLAEHHDVLRSTFGQNKDAWTQKIAPTLEHLPLHFFDFCDLADAQSKDRFEDECRSLQSSLDLINGPLFRVGYFHFGASQRDRLFMTIHHLIIDGLSWRIILEDFYTLYQQHLQKSPIKLPPKTTSFPYWAKTLLRLAQLESTKDERDHWISLNSVEFSLSQNNDQISNNVADVACVDVSLDEKNTKHLLQHTPSAFNTHINVLFLIALTRSMRLLVDRQALYVMLEGHGREQAADDVDVSRTVGWFTTIFPVYLDFHNVDGIKNQVSIVHKNLTSIHHNGISYGLLRYLTNDELIKKEMNRIPKPPISFNYLGQFDRHSTQGFHAMPFSSTEQSPRSRREFLIDIGAVVRENNLQVRFAYAKQIFAETKIKALAQEFISQLTALNEKAFVSNVSSQASFDKSEIAPGDFDAILNELES